MIPRLVMESKSRITTHDGFGKVRAHLFRIDGDIQTDEAKVKCCACAQIHGSTRPAPAGFAPWANGSTATSGGPAGRALGRGARCGVEGSLAIGPAPESAPGRSRSPARALFVLYADHSASAASTVDGDKIGDTAPVH
jgi:hypothetical protein